ncbi:flavin reductase family protein [Castellaniella sp.]|uniref:flavin reductase family protein n=1 Tax=Castellaniella sp. TaxID=1955812 RepID=UPI003560E5F8
MVNTESPVERGMFLEAMRCVASTVAVVTTDGEAGRAGLTISALSSLSAEPPSVLICINRCSGVLGLIQHNKSFCVNLLGRQHLEIAEIFAGRVPHRRHDRFACANWASGATGAPMLDEAMVALDCELASHLSYASHEILIGRVAHIRIARQEPLVYLDRSYYEVGAPARSTEVSR